jgi:hypothetical protein
MTPELRAALRLVAESHPTGSTVAVLREHLLDLLDGTPAEAPQPLGDLTCKAAGAILGRHASTLRAMCERGELPGAYRQHGREWRIPPAGLEAYRAQQRAPRPTQRANCAELSGWRRHLPKTA